MEDHGAGAENLLNAMRVFSGDGDDHVNKLCGKERLPEERFAMPGDPDPRTPRTPRRRSGQCSRSRP
jgi:hypothetical protein